MEENEEGNSLLNSLYRDYIQNYSEPGDGKGKLRERMRKRVLQGLYDIVKVNQYARKKDIKQIFERKNGDFEVKGDQPIPDKQGIMRRVHWVPVRHMISLGWRGLRLNGMDKETIFEKVVCPAIEEGEGQYHGVDRSRVESEISLETLETHTIVSEMDPVEKLERGLGLSKDDIQEIHDRLDDHPEVDSILGEDILDLAEEHLSDESTE